jgi:predicted XRE-type DNA-binding protein
MTRSAERVFFRMSNLTYAYSSNSWKGLLNNSKRERLQAAGWKVGGAREFLGLSDEENEIVELKIRLADALRAQRTRRKLMQHQLAKLLGTSQSRVAKIEAGDPSVSIDLMFRSLLRMGASRTDLGIYVSGSRARRRAAQSDAASMFKRYLSRTHFK